MAPRHWATKEQLEFLRGKKNAFIEAQKTKRYDQFWADLQREWFERWKEEGQETLPASEDAEQHRHQLRDRLDKRIKQLKNWFNNTSKSKSVPKAQSQFEFKARPTRLPQKEEYFASKHYKTHVAPLVQIEVENSNGKSNEKQPIQAIKRAMREAYANAPEHMRQEVVDDLAEMKRVKEEERKNSHGKEDSSDGERTAEEYAAAIEELPSMLLNFFDEISRKTGWAFSLIGGGPDPVNGGRIRTMGHHCGRNLLGHTFKQAHPSYSESFIVPYGQFLQHVFPHDVCQRRSLLGDNGYSDTSGPYSAASSVTANVSSTGSPDGMPNEARDETFGETSSTPAVSSPGTRSTTPTSPDMGMTWTVDVPNTAITDRTNSAFFSDGLTTSANLSYSYGQDTSNVFDFPVAEGTNLPQDKVLDPTLDPALNPAMLSWTNNWTEEELNALFSFDLAWQANANIQTSIPGSTEAPNLFALSNGTAAFQDLTPLPNSTDVPEMPSLSLPSTNSVLEMGAPSDPAQSDVTASNPGVASRQPLSDVSQNPVLPVESSIAGNFEASAALTTNDSDDNGSTKVRKRKRAEIEQYNCENTETNGRSQRNRKPAASKEVVALSDRVLNSRDNSPGWLTYAKGYLADQALGSQWSDCIDAWMEFELSLASESSASRLGGTKLRPPVLSRWLQTRKYQNIPVLTDAAEFAKDWITWWSALQPEGRKPTSVDSLPNLISMIPPGTDLRNLRKGGPNGVVTVIIALKWWGESKHDAERWIRAVVDVQECLDALVSGTQGGDGPAKKRQK